MQVYLPKHKYNLDNNLWTVEPRAVDPHCFNADPEPDPDPDLDPAPDPNLDVDPDPDPAGGGGGWPAKNVHPPGKIRGTPLPHLFTTYIGFGIFTLDPNCSIPDPLFSSSDPGSRSATLIKNHSRRFRPVH
jgi:hypothetical protein